MNRRSPYRVFLVLMLLVASMASIQASASAVPAKGAVSVEVRLRGATGAELASMRVGEVEVFSGTISTDWMLIEASISSMATGALELAFLNDASDGDLGGAVLGDRSLEVDYLALGDTVIPADSPLVYSEGAYNPPNGCSPGFVQSKTLGCGGKMVFGILDEAGNIAPPIDPHGNQRGLALPVEGDVDVVARGHFGGERFVVRIGDTIVGEASTTRFWRTYRFTSDAVRSGDVSVEFVSDFWAASAEGTTTFDANLDLDYITIDGIELQAEDAWSTGTYTGGDGCVPGFHQSETLHCNGMFVFGRG